MRKITKLLAIAAMLGLVAAGSSAQDEPKKKGTRQGGAGIGGGMGMMTGGGGVYGLLATNKALIEELKITDDQKKKLEDVAKTVKEKRDAAMKDVNFREMTEEQRKEYREKADKLAEESKKAFGEVLNKDQAARVQQISYQMQGVRAFSDKNVQEGLKLGDEQKEKIKSIMEQYQKDSRELFGGGRGFGGGRPSEEDMKKMQDNMKKVQALGKEAEEKIAEGLSDEQKKLWKGMIGEKFDVSKLTQGLGGRTRQDN